MARKKVTPRGYRDLHEHIEALRDADLLVEVTRPINKDTEMHPLVRWQYRGGIAEKDRKAFLFTNVIDSKGRKFDIPVLVCGLGGNPAIYEIGIRHPLDQIKDLWSQALNNPLAPEIIDSADAPCHEQVFEGAALMDGHGLDDIPVPISTPGWDNAPYTSSSHFITKDPDNGIQNVGNYRGQVKAPDRIGINTSVELRTGGYIHWLKWKARGEPMPCAVVVGCPPIVSYGSVQKMPEDQDEMAVTGALAGSPIRMVAAKTVDLLVPADAEVIIEGFVDTEYLEPEAPFGESHGYINLCEYNGFLDITAITRRKDAVITSWMSQVAPSESSVIRRFAFEAAQTRYLRDSLGIQGLIAVKAHENLTSLQRLVAIVFERSAPRTEIWRAMYGIASFRRAEGKWIVAVNDDIDPGNGDNSYATGNVNGSGNSVGGLVGDVYNVVTIDNSYAIGNVNGSINVGGLAGNLGDGNVSNSFSTGNVSGSSNVGGLVGTNNNEINNSYWFNSSGNPGICVGNDLGSTDCTGQTTESYFFNVNNAPMNVWNFVNIWDNVFDGITYPPLQPFDDGNVSKCRTVSNAAVVNKLTRNITSEGTCINIGADNVVLDCAGFSITYGTGGGNDAHGIDVIGRENVTIKNCNIEKNSSISINGCNAQQDINISGNRSFGIFFKGTSFSLIEDNSILTNGEHVNTGVRLKESSSNIISNNNIITSGLITSPRARG